MPSEIHFIVKAKGSPSGKRFQLNGTAPAFDASTEELITVTYNYTQPMTQTFWKVWTQ